MQMVLREIKLLIWCLFIHKCKWPKRKPFLRTGFSKSLEGVGKWEREIPGSSRVSGVLTMWGGRGRGLRPLESDVLDNLNPCGPVKSACGADRRFCPGNIGHFSQTACWWGRRRQGRPKFLGSMDCIPFKGVVLTVLKHVQAIPKRSVTHRLSEVCRDLKLEHQ